MIRRTRTAHARTGFTLVEVVASTLIMTVLFLCLAGAVDMAGGSESTVAKLVGEARELREVTKSLGEELELSTDGEIIVTENKDGTCDLTFQTPMLDAEGTLVWGVEYAVAGESPIPEPQEDWSIRYTARTEGGDLRLFRQVLDKKGNVRDEETLVEALWQEAEHPFWVEEVGDIWRVTVVMAPKSDNGEGQETSIHVRLRN